MATFTFNFIILLSSVIFLFLLILIFAVVFYLYIRWIRLNIPLDQSPPIIPFATQPTETLRITEVIIDPNIQLEEVYPAAQSLPINTIYEV